MHFKTCSVHKVIVTKIRACFQDFFVFFEDKNYWHKTKTSSQDYYYTHLTVYFPGQLGQAGIRKVKPVWI